MDTTFYMFTLHVSICFSLKDKHSCNFTKEKTFLRKGIMIQEKNKSTHERSNIIIGNTIYFLF